MVNLIYCASRAACLGLLRLTGVFLSSPSHFFVESVCSFGISHFRAFHILVTWHKFSDSADIIVCVKEFTMCIKYRPHCCSGDRLGPCGNLVRHRQQNSYLAIKHVTCSLTPQNRLSPMSSAGGFWGVELSLPNLPSEEDPLVQALC